MRTRPSSLILCVATLLGVIHCQSPERTFVPEGDVSGDGDGDGGETGGGANSMGGSSGGGSGQSCEVGYTGSDCTTCDEGFAPSGDQCVADCGSCGSHEVCEREGGEANCVCAPTYTRAGASEPCVFDEAIVSPQFTDPSAWSTDQVTLDPTAYGPMAGAVTWDETGICNGASLSQTVTMPPHSVSAPLLIEIQSERAPVTYDCILGGDDPGSALRLGDQVLSLDLVNTPSEVVVKTEVCLGAAAFGGEVEFEIVPETALAQCSGTPPCPPPALRSVLIREASEEECPAVVGEVVNGSFDDDSFWDIYAMQANGQGTVSAEITEGKLEMSASLTCSDVSATAPISVPLDSDFPNAAIRLEYSGGFGDKLQVSMNSGGERALGDELIGAGLGTEQVATICIPEFARGLVQDYKFELVNSSGACNLADQKDFVIDNVELVSDAACAHDVLRDGDFELGEQLGVSSWHLTNGDEGCGNCEGDAEIVADSGLAHSGSRVLAVDWGGIESFGTADAYTVARIPEAGGAGGAALKYWHRATGAGSHPITTSVGGNVTSTSTWTEETICIADYLGGQLHDISFSVGNATTGAGVVYIDDVSIELDANCPE